MTDFLTQEQRSRRMAAVRQRDTQPELALRQAMHRLGSRYRIHVKALVGTPDIVFPKSRVIVFVHGCFWHRHKNCRLATTPKSNQLFWVEKFDRNVARDAEQIAKLTRDEWQVHVVWQCQLSTAQGIAKEAATLAALINRAQLQSYPHGEIS